MTQLAERGPEPAGDPAAAMRDDILAGLSTPRKSIPAKYFYDTTGSLLFEEITQLPEYYPTRTEVEILTQRAAEIAALVGPGAVVIEFGAGATRKIRLLLDALQQPAAFIPIDIAGEHLAGAARALAADYPGLKILPVAGDYTRRLELPLEGPLSRGKRMVFFPGSTIGNFTPDEADAFLRQTRELVGTRGEMLVGVDLKKDPAILNAAYNDAQGVTAAFNLNLLHRMNRELGADFDPVGFRHCAFYDEQHGRIEMHLLSTRQQIVRIAGQVIEFAEGESIHTENSYKFTIPEFQRIAANAGFDALHAWTDTRRLFSLHYLRVT